MILRPATYEDWENLLLWRNDSLTRQNTESDRKITVEEHQNWLKSRGLVSEDLKIYIAEVNRKPIGTIRAEALQNPLPKVSWTIAPSERNKGYGFKMVEAFIREIQSHFRVEIKKQDHFSQQIVKKLNFEFEKEEKEKLHYKI